MTAAEIESAMRSPEHMTFYVRLADRFGDNGLISVFIGRREGADLHVDIWLMSCRVFGRGVERLLCNRVVEEARALGIEVLHGVFIPTKKNGLVRGHYPAMGFSAVTGVAASDDGREHWRLEIADYEPADVAIELVDDY